MLSLRDTQVNDPFLYVHTSVCGEREMINQSTIKSSVRSKKLVVCYALFADFPI